ncbi:unnamed protein product, partial [Rotaria socialis]
TIDCLISSLKHMREKIKTINHDDTHPLNLSKPKVQQHVHDDEEDDDETVEGFCGSFD